MADQRDVFGDDPRVPLEQRFERSGRAGNEKAVDLRGSPRYLSRRRVN